MALRLFVGLCFAACATLTAFGARAADPYPAKPVRIVVPFGPGGVADFTIRVVAGKLSERMGRQFIVENKPGAGGIAAAQAVTQSKPDGYTLFLLSNGTAVSASLFKSLPFDPVKDFAAVSTLAYFSLGIVVNGEGRIGTLADLLAAGKAGSTLNAGTINIGSTQHLAAELFKAQTGVDLTIVPYKNSPDVVAALRAKDVQVAFEILPPLIPQIRGGWMRALAVTGEQRFPGLPNVPTAIESGLADYKVTSWNGIAAPAGTPAEVIARLNQEINAVVAMPDVRQKLEDLGVEARGSTPEALERLLVAEIGKWKQVVERAKIERQ
jgi:tripartite-type tricarboxylate transporter receptor subunit TctC